MKDRHNPDTEIVKEPNELQCHYATQDKRDAVEKDSLSETEQVKRFHGLQRALDRALAHATDQCDLMTQACRIVADAPGYCAAWVGLADDEEAGALRPALGWNDREGLMDMARPSVADALQIGGLAGEALRTRRPCVGRGPRTGEELPDTDTDIARQWPGSSLALPLIVRDTLLGVLCIHSTDIDAFGPAEREFLEELAHSLAFGIEAHRALETARNAGQSLAEAREELEARVSERTAELVEANELLRREIAERRKIEDLLRRSETRYKELAELLPQIVFELDANANFSFINCSGLEALGYSWRDLRAGIKAIDLLVPGDRERFATSMSRVLHGRKLGGIEYVARRKDGTTFPLLVYSSPIERDNAIQGIRGVAIDITDLRKTQEDLWIKNFAMASSINAIAMCDLNGRLTYVNPSFLKLWRYEHAREVRERSVTELWHNPEESAKAIETLAQEGWWIGELTACRKDGSQFAAQVSATVVTDETGQPIGMMASFLDVTERTRVREALRSSEERFRAVFEGARDCIYIKDRSLRYTHVNRAAEKLLGRPAAELLGRRAEDIFGPEAGKRINEVNLRVLAGEWVEEEHTRPVNGEPLTFHEVSVPLRNQSGEISGTCTISRNVTERKKTQPAPRITVQDYPSAAMREALERARHAATRDSIVLLHGESGSGKDYVAQWIHGHSSRAGGPFFAINCAALPQELAESELFGHEPGAFTGARARKRGLLELAEGGTILLNEIGELSLALQSKLLTFLDTRSFLRVGGEKRISIHARLMAATHRDLEKEVACGRFLPALFYRLNVFSVHVPPLRERREDFPLLVDEIMSTLASDMQLTETPAIDSDTLSCLIRYHWPGNVRELRNVLERSLMLWEKGPLRVFLPESQGPDREWAHTVRFPRDRTLNDLMGELTAAVCREALRRADGNKTEAADRLGISRYTLYRHMKSLEVMCEDETDI